MLKMLRIKGKHEFSKQDRDKITIFLFLAVLGVFDDVIKEPEELCQNFSPSPMSDLILVQHVFNLHLPIYVVVLAIWNLPIFFLNYFPRTLMHTPILVEHNPGSIISLPILFSILGRYFFGPKISSPSE